jgi:predicted exporter
MPELVSSCSWKYTRSQIKHYLVERDAHHEEQSETQKRSLHLVIINSMGLVFLYRSHHFCVLCNGVARSVISGLELTLIIFENVSLITIYLARLGY